MMLESSCLRLPAAAFRGLANICILLSLCCLFNSCLLYTSDAADDSLRVDLGGQHMNKKSFFFFQAEDGIRDRSPSRGLGDVYKRQPLSSKGVNLFYRWDYA